MNSRGLYGQTLVAILACILSNQPAPAAHHQGSNKVSNKTHNRGQLLFKGKVTLAVAKAESLFMQRKYSEAADLFRKQINKNSKNYDAYAGLGLSLAMQFKLDGAGEQFEKALALDPENPVAHAGKALVILNRLQSSDQSIISNREPLLKEAEENARRAVESDPDLQQAHYILGKVLMEQGNNSAAYQTLQQALEVDPEYSPTLTALGQIDLKEGRLDQAEANLRKAIELNSGNSTAHFALGELLLAKGAPPEQAIKELNISSYQHGNSAPLHMALGKAYDRQGNYDAALKQFERAALIKPELKEAYTHMADLHVKLGKQLMDQPTTVGALKEFKQAILIDPLNPTPYTCMAELREKRGDLDQAISELRSGLELIPDDASLNKKIGNDSLKLGRLDDAIAAYEKVLRVSADGECVHGLTQALYLKAQGQSQESFLASSDYEDAEATLQRAIKLQPNDLKLQLAWAKLRSLAGRPMDLASVGAPNTMPEKIAFAEALLAQNKFDASSEQMKTVISQLQSPQDAFAVAELSIMNKDHDSAETAFKKAESLGGQNRAKYGLAAVKRLRDDAQEKLNLAGDLAKKNQLTSAADTYRDAISANPRLPGARLGLAKVEEKTTPTSPENLRNAVTQYEAYLALDKTLPEKQRTRMAKHVESLKLKATKLEAKKAIASK